MKKIELIELTQDYLSGGDAPADVKGRYHPRILSNIIALAFDGIVFDTYMEAMSHSDYSTMDAWAKNYTRTISSGQVLLPYPPVQLPNGMGILQVTPVISGTAYPEQAFAYRETNSQAVFDVLEEVDGGDASYRPGCFWLERNIDAQQYTHILKLDNIPTNCTQVIIKMVESFKAVDDYDAVAIPAGKGGGRPQALLDYVVQMIRDKGRQDIINDNNAQS